MAGIVLFAKQSGKTSFSSLFTIKRALCTKKVGHTGTLDSFADGLLVVLSDSLTRLVSHITDFDKCYEAVIKFGEETDTLDPTGKIIKKSKLPTDTEFFTNLLKFQGEIEQEPPMYSALHINGQRASDIARSGKIPQIPKRKIFIHNLEVVDVQMSCGANSACSKCSCATCEKYVQYVHLRLKVSKGTYIRSIARDIAYACNSTAHLIALRRTKVGPFSLEDAAGYKNLQVFNIQNAISNVKNIIDNNLKNDCKKTLPNILDENQLINEIIQKTQSFSPELAKLCGFDYIILKDEYAFDFFNGKALKKIMFEFCDFLSINNQAVFTKRGSFCGVIKQKKYLYVIPQNK